MSVAVHAFLGYAVTFSGVPAAPDAPEVIQIDYVRQEKKEGVPAVKTAPEADAALPAAPPRKKLRGIPVPRVEASSKTPVPSAFQKIVDEKIQKQLSQLQKLETPPSEPPKISSSMTSAELIAYPVKGSIFIGYFGQVKKKIQSTVFQKAGKSSLYGRGSVCLGFILDSTGRVEHVTVLDKGTDAGDTMKELAVQCIRDSAPFGNFPKDLGPRHIYFNITIFFDGT